MMIKKIKNFLLQCRNKLPINKIHTRFLGNNKFIGQMRGGNSLMIDSTARLTNCRITFAGKKGKVVISKNCIMTNMTILLEGNHSEVHIGEGVRINATPTSPTRLNAIEGSRIVVGSNSLFSNGVELHTSDYHSILLKDTQERINPADDIIIGEHVWIGLRSLVLKGTHIRNDSIIGADSLVCKIFESSNVLIVGTPAKVVKTNVSWDFKKI